jgi:hypothetical protein
MSTLMNGTVKALLCGVAAMMVTTTMSWSVVHSTATYPWATDVTVARATAPVAKVALQTRHTWFGQPAPAVLVD